MSPLIREGGSGGGARPSPLNIHRSSHLIRKADSPPPPPPAAAKWPSSSNTAPSDGDMSINSGRHHQQQRQQQRPVIIYTRSPKVIHTEPHDFMALVQKLTGMPRSPHDDHAAGGGRSARPVPPARSPPPGVCGGVKKALPAGSDESSTTSENGTGDEVDEHGIVRLSAAAPAVLLDRVSPPAAAIPCHPCTNLALPDVPIFAPSARYYCSPNPNFHYRPYWPDVGFSPSHAGNPLIFSPSETYGDYI